MAARRSRKNDVGAPPAVAEDALEQDLAVQERWLRGSAFPPFVSGLPAVLGDISWRDFDEEWSIRCRNAVAVRNGTNAVITCSLEAQRGRKKVRRDVVLGSVPLLQAEGRFIVGGRSHAVVHRMVPSEGPWLGIEGRNSFGVITGTGTRVVVRAAGTRWTITLDGRTEVDWLEVEDALERGWMGDDPSPGVGVTVRAFQEPRWSALGRARCARVLGKRWPTREGAQRTFLMEQVRAFLGNASREVPPTVLKGRSPDWHLRTHVEALEEGLRVFVQALAGEWLRRPGKEGKSANEFLRRAASGERVSFDEFLEEPGAEAEDVFAPFVRAADRLPRYLPGGAT